MRSRTVPHTDRGLLLAAAAIAGLPLAATTTAAMQSSLNLTIGDIRAADGGPVGLRSPGRKPPIWRWTDQQGDQEAGAITRSRSCTRTSNSTEAGVEAARKLVDADNELPRRVGLGDHIPSRGR